VVNLSPYTTTAQVLALCRFSGVNPRLFEALMRHFGDLQQVFDAAPAAFVAIEGVTPRVAERLRHAHERLAEAQSFEQELNERDIHAVTWFEPSYPELLMELHDPPPLLYFRGRLPAQSRRTVAVVGSREISAHGIELTSQAVKTFVKAGVQIVSSLRGGADVTAHLAAKAAGGESYAVLDCGLDHVEPQTGIPVALDIVQRGGVVFEYSPEQPPGDITWKAANRLIVGLSQAVVATATNARSERTIDTLKSCHEIGKLAFIMVDPVGAPDDPRIIEQAVEYGAIPLDGHTQVEDIIRSLV